MRLGPYTTLQRDNPYSRVFIIMDNCNLKRLGIHTCIHRKPSSRTSYKHGLLLTCTWKGEIPRAVISDFLIQYAGRANQRLLILLSVTSYLPLSFDEARVSLVILRSNNFGCAGTVGGNFCEWYSYTRCKTTTDLIQCSKHYETESYPTTPTSDKQNRGDRMFIF